MAAEVETLAYMGKVPWHGIGFELKETPTPIEILKAAQLDWTVSKRPMFTANNKDFTNKPTKYDLLIPDMHALVRDSDNKFLGVCGPVYQPFQNSEVFDFFNKFTDAGHMKMEVAGSLKGGLWVWALARLEGEAFNLMNGDLNYSYLLLTSPHIWGEAMTVMFTSIRVVCWNTLTQAMNKTLAEKFRFCHRCSFADVKTLAELSVEQAMINKAVYEQKVKLLAETKIVDMTKLYTYISRIIKPKVTTEVKPVEFGKPETQILTNFHNGPGAKMPSALGTWWGAFNAVTYYFDHQAGRTGNESRLYNAWLSHNQAVTKRNAFELAVQNASIDQAA